MDFKIQPTRDRSVAITEVGTRDGFQVGTESHSDRIKAEIIDALIAAGVRSFEATSFVSPRAVPQLADAHEVLARLRRRDEAHIAALVPNARGAERALGAGVDEMVCFVSASETHNQANLNAPIARSLANVAEIARIAQRTAVALRGAVACAFGCPFEGEVPVDAALRVVDAYARLGMQRTHARRYHRHGNAADRARPVDAIRDALSRSMQIALHFHNTRGIGLANVMLGLDLGIREYESSIAGWAAVRSRRAPPATSAPKTSCTCSRNAASTPASTSTR